jgi:N-acetylmuramoyl-L-alanine amidase
MSNRIITLGAGHGGIDSGAIGPSGLKEKDCTLAVVKKAGKLLSDIGEFDVKLLRNADIYIGVRERGQMAAKLGSICHVEVHFNAFNRKSSYVEVFRSATLPNDTFYAQKMSDRIAFVLGVKSKGAQIRYGTAVKGGALTDYYGVINCARTGGVPHIFFAECGFIDYAQTEALLKQQSTLDAIAIEVAKTICELFGIVFNSNTTQDNITASPVNNTASQPVAPVQPVVPVQPIAPVQLAQPQTTPVTNQKLEKVCAGTYYVREKPAFDAKVIGIVKGGQMFYTVPAESGFKRIIFNAKTGYVGPGAW